MHFIWFSFMHQGGSQEGLLESSDCFFLKDSWGRASGELVES